MKEYKELNQIGRHLELYVDDVFLRIEYDAECVEEIYEDVKKCKWYDNKTTYEIITENNKKIYVMYYDNYIYFGLSIKKGEFYYRLYHRKED